MRSPMIVVVMLLLGSLTPAIAQHEQHEMTMPQGMPPQMPHMEHAMMPANPIGLPMSRESSGTSWMPDSTPVYGLMNHSGAWDLMYHGNVHLEYDQQNGPRGDTKTVSQNWAMLMAYREVDARSRLRLSAMLSLEPLTVGGSGYPLLFQTGETWQGKPLIDHQHPHNFFSELSADYTHAFTPDSGGYVYLAPVGEPALGPPTYMHRTFGLDDPFAPLGHHWQDSTHIAFGIVTLGYQRRDWQLEGSTFNGREPGENRYIIRGPKFDSFSGRLSYNPSPDWALQASYGFLKSPEELHPEEDTHRLTASAIYNRSLSLTRNFQSTLVYGLNTIDGLDLSSILFEAEIKRDGGWSLYTRYEWIQKNAEELVLPSTFAPDQVFNLQQITLGTVKDLPLRGDYLWGIGAQINLNLAPNALNPVYGNNPTGWLIYLRVHPKRMMH